MLITIFTPTYNRAYKLKELFDSLMSQTFNDFEWVVVDDGSTDGTEPLIAQFKNKAPFPIKYIKTPNGGKHRAINEGVRKASGSLFFIVDSDDNLPQDALQIIATEWGSISPERQNELAGLCGERNIIGSKNDSFPFESLECSAMDLTYKYNIYFDKSEIFRTEVLKQYPFPTFESEKFVPESFIWNLITNKFPMHYFNKKVYNSEYLDDGYTKNFRKNLISNPKGFALFYKSIVSNKHIPLIQRIKSLLRVLQCYYYILLK